MSEPGIVVSHEGVGTEAVQAADASPSVALQETVLGETRVRVRYAETDQMGVVYNANYLIWFEVGRAELIRQMGLDYKAMEREDGCGIAVVEVNCRYKAPARYDDELMIRTRIVGVRGSVIKFAYEIKRSENGALLCEGVTTHVVVDREMKRTAMPVRYSEAFRAAHVPLQAT